MTELQKQVFWKHSWLLKLCLLCLTASSTLRYSYGEVAEMSCEADGTCANIMEEEEVETNRQFGIEIINESEYEVDVHWDDGMYGRRVSTLDENGGQTSINTFVGHQFFITRHGVKEGLFHLATDTQYRFTATEPDQVFVIPEDAAPSPNICQDRFSSCSNLSQNQGCWNSPGWMIVHCCKSCDKDLDASRLIDSKVRCSRENLNITTPAWQPGDLNKLFTSWATEEKYLEFEPKVYSSPNGEHGGKDGPWVIVFDNFLSDEEADALIKGGHLVGFERSTNQGETNALGEQQRVVSKTRTSSNAWCRHRCEELPEVQAVTERIQDVTGVPVRNYENFQILEYDLNQFYRQHHDSSHRSEKPAGSRIMTFFLYLSDVEEGGETHFGKLNLSVKPKKGRALVWPSVMDDDPEFWDKRMYHEAKPVMKGKKFAANHWIHMYDFATPNEWGCTGSFS